MDPVGGLGFVGLVVGNVGKGLSWLMVMGDVGDGSIRCLAVQLSVLS
jgi:hypothetical protein